MLAVGSAVAGRFLPQECRGDDGGGRKALASPREVVGPVDDLLDKAREKFEEELEAALPGSKMASESKWPRYEAMGLSRVPQILPHFESLDGYGNLTVIYGGVRGQFEVTQGLSELAGTYLLLRTKVNMGRGRGGLETAWGVLASGEAGKRWLVFKPNGEGGWRFLGNGLIKPEIKKKDWEPQRERWVLADLAGEGANSYWAGRILAPGLLEPEVALANLKSQLVSPGPGYFEWSAWWHNFGGSPNNPCSNIWDGSGKGKYSGSPDFAEVIAPGTKLRAFDDRDFTDKTATVLKWLEGQGRPLSEESLVVPQGTQLPGTGEFFTTADGKEMYRVSDVRYKGVRGKVWWGAPVGQVMSGSGRCWAATYFRKMF